MREGRGVVDLEPVEQGIGVEKTEPLDHVKIPVPPEVAARVPVEAAAVVEVRRVHHERGAGPVTDRIAQPQPDIGWKMRTAVQTNDSGVVDHLRVHDECIPGLHDLVVAVVGIRKHGRPGGEERQTLILKTRILGARGVLHRVDTAALGVGSRGREGGNAAIGRVGDDGGAEGLDGAGAELAVERIVGAGAGVLRGGLGRRLLIAFSDLAFPLRGFFGREEGFVLQLQGAFR